MMHRRSISPEVSPSSPDFTNCRRLWCDVLLRGLREAYTIPVRSGITKNRTKAAQGNWENHWHAKERAHADSFAWIGTSDFREVCWYAGIDPDAALHRLKDRAPEESPAWIKKFVEEMDDGV